ncbi:MAG TPA: citrate/2-methylcitrate synthase [Anaerolineae bacterium]|nr:citrate/2-methylcitrate synthase [Anaerolineae bacterium]
MLNDNRAKITFTLARTAGWIAHCREQQATNRLIRPTATYIGDHNRAWSPLNTRSPLNTTYASPAPLQNHHLKQGKTELRNLP